MSTSLLWKFVPHFREIDEEEIAARLGHSRADTAEKQQLAVAPTTYEVRDEANRPWYKVFDEYEYRPKTAVDSQRRWYHWYDKNDTPEERRLLMKLDLLLCSFTFAMYWVKYLDQANLNNAYVSGMKEGLGMQGNDLVDTQSIYTVGAVVFQIPFMYLIQRYPANLMLPFMDLGWGLFTLAIFKANSVGQLQAFRFFVGAFESAFYPTVNYLMGSWYKPKEFARRGGIFYWGQFVGVMTAGLLQSAAFQNLHLVNGLEGWRWMFIIDAIITLPIAVIGVWALPGTPGKCYSLFLTDDEIYLARKRLRDDNINIEDDSKAFFTWGLWKSLLSDWKFYFFTFFNTLSWNNSNMSSGSYILWLQSLHKYSIPKINQLSTITPALGIVYVAIVSFIADNLQTRCGALVFSQTFNWLGNVILAIWDVPEGAKWFAFALQYFASSHYSVTFGWMSDAMRGTPQQRAITTISLNMFGQAVTAWTPLLVWRTVEAPRYLKGFTFAATCAFCMIILAFVILVFYKNDERKHASDYGILVYNSSLGEEVPTVPEQRAKADAASLEDGHSSGDEPDVSKSVVLVSADHK